jgi:hypothetical protein
MFGEKPGSMIVKPSCDRQHVQVSVFTANVIERTDYFNLLLEEIHVIILYYEGLDLLNMVFDFNDAKSSACVVSG